jgi:hypothetical protein
VPDASAQLAAAVDRHEDAASAPAEIAGNADVHSRAGDMRHDGVARDPQERLAIVRIGHLANVPSTAAM